MNEECKALLLRRKIWGKVKLFESQTCWPSNVTPHGVCQLLEFWTEPLGAPTL